MKKTLGIFSSLPSSLALPLSDNKIEKDNKDRPHPYMTNEIKKTIAATEASLSAASGLSIATTAPLTSSLLSQGSPSFPRQKKQLQATKKTEKVFSDASDYEANIKNNDDHDNHYNDDNGTDNGIRTTSLTKPKTMNNDYENDALREHLVKFRLKRLDLLSSVSPANKTQYGNGAIGPGSGHSGHDSHGDGSGMNTQKKLKRPVLTSPSTVLNATTTIMAAKMTFSQPFTSLLATQFIETPKFKPLSAFEIASSELLKVPYQPPVIHYEGQEEYQHQPQHHHYSSELRPNQQENPILTHKVIFKVPKTIEQKENNGLGEDSTPINRIKALKETHIKDLERSSITPPPRVLSSKFDAKDLTSRVMQNVARKDNSKKEEENHYHYQYQQHHHHHQQQQQQIRSLTPPLSSSSSLAMIMTMGKETATDRIMNMDHYDVIVKENSLVETVNDHKQQYADMKVMNKSSPSLLSLLADHQSIGSNANEIFCGKERLPKIGNLPRLSLGSGEATNNSLIFHGKRTLSGSSSHTILDKPIHSDNITPCPLDLLEHPKPKSIYSTKKEDWDNDDNKENRHELNLNLSARALSNPLKGSALDDKANSGEESSNLSAKPDQKRKRTEINTQILLENAAKGLTSARKLLYDVDIKTRYLENIIPASSNSGGSGSSKLIEHSKLKSKQLSSIETEKSVLNSLVLKGEAYATRGIGGTGGGGHASGGGNIEGSVNEGTRKGLIKANLPDKFLNCGRGMLTLATGATAGGAGTRGVGTGGGGLLDPLKMMINSSNKQGKAIEEAKMFLEENKRSSKSLLNIPNHHAEPKPRGSFTRLAANDNTVATMMMMTLSRNPHSKDELPLPKKTNTIGTLESGRVSSSSCSVGDHSLRKASHSENLSILGDGNGSSSTAGGGSGGFDDDNGSTYAQGSNTSKVDFSFQGIGSSRGSGNGLGMPSPTFNTAFLNGENLKCHV